MSEQPNPPLIYSHIRSGTHLLAAFIGENFFGHQKALLRSKMVRSYHWAQRGIVRSVPWGKLFGDHYHVDFARDDSRTWAREINGDSKKVYIFRDGRAVAASLFKTKQFLHPSWRPLSFERFLSAELDFYGSPGNRSEECHTIADHWLRHVEGWNQSGIANVLFIRYERLLASPKAVRNSLAAFLDIYPIGPLVTVDRPVGVAPHQGGDSGWKSLFTVADLEAFHQIVPENSPYLWRP